MKASESSEGKKGIHVWQKRWEVWEKRSRIWFRLLYTGRNKEKKVSLNHQVKHAILKFQKSYPYCYKTISCKSKCASQRAHVSKGTNTTTAVIYSSRYLSVLVPVPFTGPPFSFSLTYTNCLPKSMQFLILSGSILVVSQHHPNTLPWKANTANFICCITVTGQASWARTGSFPHHTTIHDFCRNGLLFGS